MFTRGGASGNQNEKRQLQRSSGDELDDFLEEQLQRRPEVRIINRYAVFMAYIRFGVKGVGALALLWATVVLLGGFVSSLEKDDFWYLTVIAFIQAAGVFDAMGDARFVFLANWIENLKWRTHSVIDFTLIVVFTPVVYSAVLGPSVCILLSLFRITNSELDYGEANLKRALKLFYYLSIVHGAICLLCMVIETTTDEGLVEKFSRRHGLNPEVLDGYLHQTKQMCVNNLESIESWNLIVYGAGLLDSQLPEDYASGGRVLNMLIDQDTPVLITRLLIRSPRQRIQKLIETLAWRNPAEREMRWLAARIVEHLAGHLNLAHFPGSLECISSLFETSCHNNGDQEALHLPFVVGRSKQKRRISSMLHEMVNGVLEVRNIQLFIFTGQFYVLLICLYLRTIYSFFSVPENAGTVELDNKQRGSDEDLLLPGLRILENLAHNRHNCTMIYNTKDLLWKIVAPVRSNELIHDIKSSTAWTKVVDGSLKVVSRLMSSSGSTSVEMCRLIAYDTNAVKNLKAVLDMDMKSNSGIIQLKIRAIEVLTQLALHHPANTSATVIREHLIVPTLHIFLQDRMGNYLKDEKMRIEHQSTNQQNTLPGASMGARVDNLVLIVSALCPLILFVGAAKARMTRAREAREFRAAEARLSVMRAEQERLMKEAQENASRLKEKAGEALAMLSSDSEAIKSFTIEVCTEDDVRRLTDLLDSSIKTIKCEIGETGPVEIEINICCRISAAVILKHLRNRDMKLTLEKVLAELLPIQAEASSTPQWWGRPISCSCIAAFGNDIENRAMSCITSITNNMEQCATRCFPSFRNNTANPSDGGHDEPSTLPIHHIQQCGERRLQAELISLVVVNLENNNFDFAAILILQPRASPVSLLEEFVVKLKKMVEDNMYATPACLAIQKLACKMVTGLLQHDGNVELINNKNIIGTLLKASKVMARFECSMIFSGVDRDCHGIALKPLSSVLAKNAEDLLTERKQDLGINIGPVVAPQP